MLTRVGCSGGLSHIIGVVVMLYLYTTSVFTMNFPFPLSPKTIAPCWSDVSLLTQSDILVLL